MVWKTYAVVIAVIALVAPAALLSSTPTVFDYIDIVTSLIASIGLIGFAFHKAIGAKVFWKAAVPTLLVWEFVYNVLISRVFSLAQRGIDVGIAEWLVGFALFVPAYFGLFLYAYRRRQLWEPVRT